MSDAGLLRVTLQQPALPKYRLPVFRELAERPGIDLTLLYGEDEGVPNVEPAGFRGRPVPHHHLGVGRRRPFVWCPAQLRAADPDHADVLVMLWNTRWLTLPLALRRARRAGIRTVVWGHGYSKDEAPWRARLRRRVADAADGVLFYSRTVADRYAADGFPAHKVFVAPNSLDQAPIAAARAAWEGDPRRLEVFREEHGVAVDEESLLFVSRFDPANGLDVLVRAVAQLAPDRPRLRLNLVGKGEPEAGRIRGLCEELGVSDRVRFLGPIYDEEELAPWFLTASAFVYPQNVGLSLLHAFGYGLPVVTSDDIASHNPEVEALEDHVNGRFYRHGDPAALAACLAGLLDDEPARHRMGEAASAAVRDRYNVARMVDGFEAAIRGHTDQIHGAAS